RRWRQDPALAVPRRTGFVLSRACSLASLASAVPRRQVRFRSGCRAGPGRCYAGFEMATLDLRTVRLRSGEQFQDVRAIVLVPYDLAGQRYLPVPEKPEGTITITRTSSGHLFELELEARVLGPCMRCLEETEVTTHVASREYQASSPGDAEELSTPYLQND